MQKIDFFNVPLKELPTHFKKLRGIYSKVAKSMGVCDSMVHLAIKGTRGVPTNDTAIENHLSIIEKAREIAEDMQNKRIRASRKFGAND